MRHPALATSRVSHRLRQQGLSLVELMVALAVGLFLLGAVGSIYVATTQSTRGSTFEAQMNEDAALALELMRQQFQLAGFSGYQSGVGANSDLRNFQGQAITGCNGGFSNANLNNNTSNFADLACTSNTENTAPDAVAIRYEANLLNSFTVLSGGVNRPANCAYEGIAAHDIGGGVNISLAENRYFIAPDPANGDIPSLTCRGRTGAAANFSDRVALIPNIEDLQILYAVTRLPVTDEVLPHQVTAYLRADEIAALGGGGGASPWNRVAGARICVVARSPERVPGLTTELRQYVDCSGTRVTAPNDGLIRRAYVTTVMARNLRPGLPAPFAAGSNPWSILTGESGG